jgi:hypothetical protein
LDQLELLVTWENSRVFKFPVEHKRNIFGFSFFIYRNNEGRETPVCHFSNTWNTIKWSTCRREFYLEDLVNEIAKWDTGPPNNVTSFVNLPIDVTLNPTQEEAEPDEKPKNDFMGHNSDAEESDHTDQSSPSTPISNPMILSSI